MHSSLLGGLARTMGRSGALETRMALYRRAIALNPRDATHYVNLAAELIAANEGDEAKTLLDAVIVKVDKCIPAWQMLGTLATHRGDLSEAIRCYHRSYEIAPDLGQAKFDLASAYLRAGRWAEGWQLYQYRHEILPSTGPMPDCPKWDGAKTGHLAVWGDQGHGDRIQFARFLPWARERSAKITLLTNPETVPLLYGYQSMLGGDITALYDPAQVKFDHHICLADLPMLYGCTPENIPPDPGLLSPAATTDKLGAPGLKIGIAWAGNRDHPNDNIRSMKFVDLLPLAADPRNSLFSLQCGPPAVEIAQARAQRIVSDMSGVIDGEWAHAAALVQNLDLVVTVDTALAHLAGALGVPTFLMVPRFNDWRWLWDRDDTPWYPSVRLFRQDKPCDWKGVVNNVLAAIRALHHQRAVIRMTNAALAPHKPGTADEKEPDVAAILRKVLRPGDCFVDVGANVGIHTVVASELVGPEGLVIAFEPGSNALPALATAVADRANVKVIAKPLSNVAEPVRFHLCQEGSGGNALWDPGEFPSNVLSRETHESSVMQASTLDLELPVLVRLAYVRLIKIDTEGAEQRVLEGALHLLDDVSPPFIVAELHEFGLAKLGCSQESLRGLMADLGYDTFTIWADGGKPTLLDRDVLFKGPFIINLLFSTAAAVDELWPNEKARQVGPMHVYRPIETKASAA